jgi:outer membrane receptor protein involved in Fe transport
MMPYSRVTTVSAWILVVLSGLVLNLPARAQTSFGAMVGTVTDNSGALIAGAEVTVTNTATGIARQMRTDQLGNYRAVSLLPGPYRVSAAREGFQVIQSDIVNVVVGATVTLNLMMPVGATTETVQVAAQAPLLDTEDSTLGTLVDHQEMVNLPLNGRAFTDLIQLMPGSLATGGFGIPGHMYSLNGISFEGTLYVIDGVVTNEYSDNKYSIQPSVDAIQEFNAQTNITSARYGGGEGGVVNVVTRTGTNQLHGTAWEFFRNTDLNAAYYFANYADQPKPAYHQNQYGFVLGGPVMIPGHYDGRDKTFWMFNWEGFKSRQDSVNFATVPTQAQLGGDFRGFAPIYDPNSTVQTGVDAQGNPIYTRTQFSCNGVLNVICPNRIDPAATAYAAALFPSTTKVGANNFLTTQSQPLDMYQLTARVDQKIGSKLNIFARYSMLTSNQDFGFGIRSQRSLYETRVKNPEVSLTYLINPTTILDLKLGVHRAVESGVPVGSSGPAAAAYNEKYPAQGIVQRGTLPTFYEGNWSGYTYTSSEYDPLKATTWNPVLNLTKVAGRHSMEMGSSIVRTWSYNDGLYTANFNFDNVPTSDPNNVANTGDSIASFLLSLPSSGTRAQGDTGSRYLWTNYAFYFQDSIKLTSKLTMNAGLRYDYDEWPIDTHHHKAEFDPDSRQYVWTGPNPATGEGPNARWPSILKPYHNGWAPRFGLAYQATPNTTVASGFGIFHGGSLLWMNQSIRGQWPYAVTQGFNGTNVINPDSPVETYFPAYTSVQLGTPPSALWAIGHNQKTTYSEQWNLNVEHEFPKNMLIAANYVGNHALHLPMNYIGNTPAPGPGTIGSPQHPLPINGIPGVGLLFQMGNYATSDYEALQVKFQKRFSDGLQLSAYYVYGKQMDLAGSSFGLTRTPQNPNNWGADWADGNYDVRHSFKAAYIYQLPFGRGKRWLGNSNGVVDAILGGWNVSGITTYRTGVPVNILIPFDNANIGTRSQRPDYIPGFPARVISSTDKTHGWLNPASYMVAPPYTFGNLGRNSARAPGLENWDFSAYKNFNIREERYFQFRGDFFNLFNHTNFGAPGSVFGNSNFGVISNAADPRFVQLGLKFVF